MQKHCYNSDGFKVTIVLLLCLPALGCNSAPPAEPKPIITNEWQEKLNEADKLVEQGDKDKAEGDNGNLSREEQIAAYDRAEKAYVEARHIYEEFCLAYESSNDDFGYGQKSGMTYKKINNVRYSRAALKKK